jgi:hypothetical protein
MPLVKLGRLLVDTFVLTRSDYAESARAVYMARDLSMRGLAIGARDPFAACADDNLHEGGNGLTNHLAEETASESDEATPYYAEFVLDGSFQLGPHCESIGRALFTSRVVHRSIGVKGIHTGLLLFGRW